VTIDADAWDFARRCQIALFATLSPRGTPFATPLWFVERDGLLCCTTSAASVTVRNVEAAGAVALLLYPARAGADGRTLRLRGSAIARRGRLPLAVVLAMLRKYYAAPDGLAVELAHPRLWPLRLRYYAQGAPALLEFRPASAEWLELPS
jgi:hypothetical protein